MSFISKSNLKDCQYKTSQDKSSNIYFDLLEVNKRQIGKYSINVIFFEMEAIPKYLSVHQTFLQTPTFYLILKHNFFLSL